MWRREQALVGWLSSLLLPCASLGIRSTEEPGIPPDAIGFLQWNMHGECFQPCNVTAASEYPYCDRAYPRCRDGATGFVKQQLEAKGEESLDFIGLEQFANAEFLESHDQQWAHITKNCGGTKGYGVYPFDSATLFYRATRWEVKQVNGAPVEPVSGCMESVVHENVNNYRAFVANAFKEKNSGFEVIVAVAHYPHEAKYPEEITMFQDALADLITRAGVSRFVLIADTNQVRDSRLVLEDVYPRADSVLSTELHETCCYPDYYHAYDRIILADFPNGSLHTALPFKDVLHHQLPEWVNIDMHDPVIGYLRAEDGHSGAKTLAAAGLSTVVSFMLPALRFFVADRP